MPHTETDDLPMAPEYTIEEKELCARLKKIDEITNHDIQRATNTFSRCIIGSRCVRQERDKIFRLIHEVEIRMLEGILRGMKEVPEKEMFRDYSSYLEYISDEVATQLEGIHIKYVLIPKPPVQRIKRCIVQMCSKWNGGDYHSLPVERTDKIIYAAVAQWLSASNIFRQLC